MSANFHSIGTGPNGPKLHKTRRSLMVMPIVWVETEPTFLVIQDLTLPLL